MSAACDVFLDSPGWSGCNSVLEGIATDLPVVTHRGALMRARHSAAILDMMGLGETIADTVEDFVAIAIRMGRDAEYRRFLRERIGQTKSAIYADKEAVLGLRGLHSARGRDGRLIGRRRDPNAVQLLRLHVRLPAGLARPLLRAGSPGATSARLGCTPRRDGVPRRRLAVLLRLVESRLSPAARRLDPVQLCDRHVHRPGAARGAVAAHPAGPRHRRRPRAPRLFQICRLPAGIARDGCSTGRCRRSAFCCPSASRSSPSRRSPSWSTPRAARHEEYDFTRYVLFVTFFPHLLAGPLFHHKEMMPQFAAPETYRLKAENFSVGLHHLHHRPVQEDRAGRRHVGVRAPVFDAASRAGSRRRRGLGRRARLHLPALLRFLGLFRHGDRRRRASASCCRSTSTRPTSPQHHRVLAALAHDLVALPARLSLYPARRQPARAPPLSQSLPHHAARRVVARRGLDLRRLGRAARGLSRGEPCLARAAPASRPRARSIWAARTLPRDRPDLRCDDPRPGSSSAPPASLLRCACLPA